MSHHRFFVGHVLDVLKTLPDESVHCVVTSPPYWGLRDYGLPPIPWPETEYVPMPGLPPVRVPAWEGQLGLESSSEMYVAHLILVFREIRRVLRKDGSLWLNLGDSFAGSWGNYHPFSPPEKHGQRPKETVRWNRRAYDGKEDLLPPTARPANGLKEKDMIGVPWRVAFALQADGWWLRSDVIWEKPNSLPESVKDRPVKSHEYVFLLSKNKKYFYDVDAIKEPFAEATFKRIEQSSFDRQAGGPKDGANPNRSCRRTLVNLKGRMLPPQLKDRLPQSIGRNKRSVWTIPTKPFSDAHFATFPPELVRICILAGTPLKTCSTCGEPWKRVVERRQTENPVSYKGSSFTAGKTAMPRPNIGQGPRYEVFGTIGWCPSCACDAPPGVEPEDFEVIKTPTGGGIGEDPSLFTGRAGFNRPRNPDEGTRPMARYEQRKYAEQMRGSPYRQQMEAEAGSAFKHYIRTDESGARPVPPELLEKWLERGWLEKVELPEWETPEPVPGIVLDPFGGAGTTTLAAMELGRDSIYIDLKREYAKMALQRCSFGGSLLDCHSYEIIDFTKGVAKTCSE